MGTALKSVQESFPRKLESLSRIFDFVREFSSRYDIAEDILFAISFSIEEAFVNMIKHGAGAGKDVSIGLALDNRRVIISLIDYDVDAFDITKSREVDITQPLHERPVGGLGIHLTKALMDDVIYEYADRISRVTLIKNLEPHHV